MCISNCFNMSLKNKIFLSSLLNKTHVFLFIQFVQAEKTVIPTDHKKQNTDQFTVFPNANATSLKQTSLAATATLLKLLLQHLREGFFFQLVSVWCLSWSVSSCARRHNLWTLESEFYLARRDTESNGQSMTETCSYLRLKVRRSSLALSRSPTENVAQPRKLLCGQIRKNIAGQSILTANKLFEKRPLNKSFLLLKRCYKQVSVRNNVSCVTLSPVI